VNAILSRGIPMWRRIPYIYLIAVLIGGTPILLSSNFGQ
jgi:ABC-type methionine transport system permease subunit